MLATIQFRIPYFNVFYLKAKKKQSTKLLSFIWEWNMNQIADIQEGYAEDNIWTKWEKKVPNGGWEKLHIQELEKLCILFT
jgi:hypothetical protein